MYSQVFLEFGMQKGKVMSKSFKQMSLKKCRSTIVKFLTSCAPTTNSILQAQQIARTHMNRSHLKLVNWKRFV